MTPSESHLRPPYPTKAVAPEDSTKCCGVIIVQLCHWLQNRQTIPLTTFVSNYTTITIMVALCP